MKIETGKSAAFALFELPKRYCKKNGGTRIVSSFDIDSNIWDSTSGGGTILSKGIFPTRRRGYYGRARCHNT